ncbi:MULTISPECIES: ATP synthase subunit I [Virgibacillus]|uniref:ATP synthase I chain n=1 Tax=Virgibacillus dokdonensis TaxID=302167 RepID=A0A2K9IWB8_9BACI|nr:MULTISPECIES: ATP synthase subunit I [Virgibacillus]AUJ24049.1 ATP synthase I chain [Virgibacillus dokdonensis]NWO15027.1 ATP synthase subunit I [Virgibacillus sp.]
MSEYKIMVARQRKWMLYLLAIFVIGAGFTPYVQIFLGLLLGTSISFYNLYLLQKKVDLFGEAVTSNQKVKTLGTLSRMTAAILAILIAIRFDAYFHIIAVIIGLMTSYPVIMIDFALSNFKQSHKKEG